MTEPGWYPDPQAPGQLRWWDGSTWTTHVATPTPAGPSVAGAPGFAPTAPPSGHRNVLIGLGVAVAVILVVAALTIPFLVGRSTPSTSATPPTSPPTTEPTSGSPTTVASTITENAGRAGIPVLDEEGSATHTHTLLRITLDGDELVVPAGIGIDTRAGQITAVHTHEDAGVLHVESPDRNDVYTLGQFLVLWGVGDDADALCATLADGPCQVAVDVVAPTAADKATFESFGPMPATPPVAPDGLDTELAQGAVIELTLTTTS